MEVRHSHGMHEPMLGSLIAIFGWFTEQDKSGMLRLSHSVQDGYDKKHGDCVKLHDASRRLTDIKGSIALTSRE